MSFLDPLWSDLAASFTATPAPVATLRLVAAMVMGGLIGFEREWHHKPAGLRTHMLISVAAALFALLSFELLEVSRQMGGAETGARNDILRLIGAVTSGVAFLAAGTIVVNAGRVKGLTTGAGSWTGAEHWSVTRIARGTESTLTGDAPLHQDRTPTRW